MNTAGTASGGTVRCIVRSVVRHARVLLADDNPAILGQAASMLGHDFEVVGELRNGESVLSEYDSLKPDVVVLDISMGRLSGIDVARQLQSSGRLAKIVFLTVHEDPDFVGAALGAGGSAYVVKSRMGTDLVSAIRAVLDGKVFVSNLLQD